MIYALIRRDASEDREIQYDIIDNKLNILAEALNEIAGYELFYVKKLEKKK